MLVRANSQIDYAEQADDSGLLSKSPDQKDGDDTTIDLLNELDKELNSGSDVTDSISDWIMPTPVQQQTGSLVSVAPQGLGSSAVVLDQQSHSVISDTIHSDASLRPIRYENDSKLLGQMFNELVRNQLMSQSITQIEQSGASHNPVSRAGQLEDVASQLGSELERVIDLLGQKDT